MQNVLIVGINGKMGKRVYNILKSTKYQVACGVDKNVAGEFDCPVYNNFDEVRESVDAIIDFSSPKCISEVLKFARDNKCQLVECATGFKKSDFEKIQEYSKLFPIFLASNTSLGALMTATLCASLAKELKNYQIEIIETHHKDKLDAPSGTAISIAEKIKQERESYQKIPIHSLRGGDVVGKHEVVFLGENETITVTHCALNKDLFAKGAIDALEYLSDKQQGLFSMENLIIKD